MLVGPFFHSLQIAFRVNGACLRRILYTSNGYSVSFSRRISRLLLSTPSTVTRYFLAPFGINCTTALPFFIRSDGFQYMVWRKAYSSGT